MFSEQGRSTRGVTGLLLLALLAITVVSTEAAASDYDRPVFEFQSKMANKGSAKAQFYLARMYEEGRGTEANPELAKYWYEQARLNGYQHNEQLAATVY